MKNTAFLPNSLDGPEIDLLVAPKKSALEEERDEARTAARELLKRVEMLQPPVLAGLRLPSVRDAWERKYPWLKVEKWP